MGDGGELPLRATDNERYSVSGGSTSENKTDKQNSIRLLEAKEEKKKEAFLPTWVWSDRCALGRNRLQRARVHNMHAQPDPYYRNRQSNNLLGTEYLVGMAAV